ncbi:MAG: prepilin-type N-terminal cleavage/methylation domain-containing protein [Bacilli bacterium]
MKKGFTLVELLAVITVLGLLAAISIPIVNNQINSSKDKAYKNQVQTIVNAAKRWGFDNDNLLNTTEKTTVSINRIQKDGYLTSGDVIDPRTEQKLTGCIEITYNSNYKQYEYEYLKNCTTTNVN